MDPMLPRPHLFNHISPSRASCPLPSAFSPRIGTPARRSNFSGSRSYAMIKCFSYHRLAIFKQAFKCDSCKKTVQTSVSPEAQINHTRQHFCNILCAQTYMEYVLQHPSMLHALDEPVDLLIFPPGHPLLVQARHIFSKPSEFI